MSSSSSSSLYEVQQRTLALLQRIEGKIGECEEFVVAAASAAAASEDNDNGSKNEDVLESFKIPPPLLPSNPKTMSSLSSSLSRSLEVEVVGKITGKTTATETGTKNTSGGKGIGKTTSKTGGGTLNSNVLLGLNGKPLPQIPINVFWNFVEAHFRPLDYTDFDEILRRGNVYSGINSDQLFLLNIRPFIMPKLGRGWREVWRERYGFDVKHSNSLSSKGAAMQVHVSSQENQSSLLKIRERLGRLLTGSDGGLDGGSNGDLDGGSMSATTSTASTITDTTETTNHHLPTHLERRIIAELPVPSRLVKIREMDLMEDDEISEDLHSLQQRLKEIHYINRWRLQRLIADSDSSFKKRMRPQEFYLLLDELDKQIEHSYLKIIKQCSSASIGGGGGGISSKKRKYSSTTSSLNASDDDDQASIAGYGGGEPRLEDEYPLIAARRKLLATFTGKHCSNPIPSRSAFMSGIPKEEIESIFDVEKEAFLMREAKISSSIVPLSCSPFSSISSSGCISYSSTDSDSNNNTTIRKVAAPLSLASFPSLLPQNK